MWCGHKVFLPKKESQDTINFSSCVRLPPLFFIYFYFLLVWTNSTRKAPSAYLVYTYHIYRRENKKQKKCTRGYAVSKHRVGLQICTCGTFMYQVRSINQWAVVPLLSTGSRLHTIKSEASILAVLDYPRFSLYTWYACTRYIYIRGLGAEEGFLLGSLLASPQSQLLQLAAERYFSHKKASCE